MKEKVVILYGGPSVEHDISIITALQVMSFAPKEYDYLPVYIDKKGVWWTAENLNDVKIYKNFEKLAKKRNRITLVMGTNEVFQQKGGKFILFCKVCAILNCCHGRIGEDGCVQGACECCNIAYSSCDTKTSALCMDKVLLKDVLEKHEIETPKYIWRDGDFDITTLKKSVQKIGYPVVVKPANLGSSIGISVCEDEQSLEKALLLAQEFDKKVLIEKMIVPLREFNCACVRYEGTFFVSSVNEVKDKGKIYTFEDKYIQKSTSTKRVEKSLEKKIKGLTEKTYKLLGCFGIVRVDFLFDDEAKKLYVNEINTIPGSLAFYLFNDIKFSELLKCLIDESIEENKRKAKHIKTFDSSALEAFEEINFKVKK